MVQLFNEQGESPPLPYRHHRTDRSWTGKHEWGKLSGTLAAADAKTFERLALTLLRLLCVRPEEPLDTAHWIPSKGGQFLLGERPPHLLFVQSLTFPEAPQELGEPHVRQVREAVKRFLESPVEATCYLLVHNSELSSPTFREGVQAEIEKLRESGKVARAETWGRQKLLGEAFNAMTDRVLAAIRAGSLSLAPITAALDSGKGAPLAQVPLRVSLLSIDQYRLRSMDDLGPRQIVDPALVILERDAGNESSETVLEASWEAMCWAASLMIEEQEGKLDLLPDCSLDRVLAATPRLEKITEASALHLQSLLLPAERKRGATTRIAFAHRVFQEFFLAWHLLSEGGAETGPELPDSVLEWVRDLQKEQLVEPRAQGPPPGLPAAHPTPVSLPRRGSDEWSPDLELLVTERLGTGRRIFDLQLTARDPRLGLNHHALPALSFDVEPAEFFRRHLSEITDLSSLGRNLADKSAFLSETILPRELLKLLSSLRFQTSTLLVQSDDPWIAWELFRIGREPESEIADGPFLCEAFAMTRWLRNVGLKVHLPLRHIAVVAPRDSGLPHAEEEWEGIAALARPDRRRIERIEPARPRHVQTVFKTAQADGWHFIAHGRNREGAPDLSVIELEEREQLTPEVLSGEGRNMGKPEPLVFLNACSSAQTGLSLIGLGGWAPRLLDIGAGAFIGTLWPIRDRRGTEFARTFYEAFTSGSPFGEAVRRARLAVRSEDDPTWLAYTAFGHPLAVCASSIQGVARRPGLTVPSNAPLSPELFVGRARDVDELKTRLGAGRELQEARPLHVLTAVRGWPGVGKSTLAAFLSHDGDIRSTFPDGVLWASLGEEPNLLSEISGWGRVLGNEDLQKAANLREAISCLRALFQGRRVLLVLDDVWDPAHARTVHESCGEGCALLLTTRQTGTARSLSGQPESVYTLQVLDEPSAFELLSALAPEAAARFPEECRELVRRLEFLPLALQVAGRLLHDESELGLDVPALIRSLGEGKDILRHVAPIDRMDHETGTIPTVEKLLQRSTDRLDREVRDRFRLLAGFAAKPATFSLEALRYTWETEDPRPTVRALVERGLLEAVGNGRFQVHSLLLLHAASLEA